MRPGSGAQDVDHPLVVCGLGSRGLVWPRIPEIWELKPAVRGEARRDFRDGRRREVDRALNPRHVSGGADTPRPAVLDSCLRQCETPPEVMAAQNAITQHQGGVAG